MISNRIMKLYEFRDCIVFRAACSCNDPSDDLWISIELDEKYKLLNLVFSANVGIYYDDYNIDDSILEKLKKFLNNLYYRFKKSFKLLFTGYIKMETDFIMDNEENIRDFLSAINNSIDKIKLNRNNYVK